MITIHQHILRRFHRNYKEGKTGWVNGQTVQDIMHDLLKKKHDTISRELRRMAEEGLLEAKEMKIPPYKVASIYYRYQPRVINTY